MEDSDFSVKLDQLPSDCCRITEPQAMATSAGACQDGVVISIVARLISCAVIM